LVTHSDQTAIKLEAPSPVVAIAPQNAVGLVALPRETIIALNTRADKFVNELAVLDANAPEFGTKVEQLIYLGRKEIAEAAGQANRFLDRPTRAIGQESGVGSDLAQLRRTIEDLDPGKQGNLLSTKKLFGIIPFGNKLRDYFDSYASAQSHISVILARLMSGKDELLKDNAAIDVERQNLWAAIGRLEQMVQMSKALDAKLEQKAGEVELSQPSKAKAIKEQAIFYVRQRTQDLLTQMAVTVQGYLALDLVKKNNIELVKGVDRASTTTVAALRTAVTVCSALTNQRLVLDQISAINKTTASIIDSTGDLLRANTSNIHEQAVSATIPLATLQRAFENIYHTMDSIDTFKATALSSMKSTVVSLSSEIEKSKSYAARSEGQATNSNIDLDSRLLTPV
jgi:uncharacterized protein YaaN involved in tellurite resistance